MLHVNLKALQFLSPSSHSLLPRLSSVFTTLVFTFLLAPPDDGLDTALLYRVDRSS